MAGKVPTDIKPTGAGATRASRRNFAPVLMLSVDNKDASDLLSVCTSFSFEKRIGKAAKATFEFRNDDRISLMGGPSGRSDPRLDTGVTWKFRFGYFSDLSPIHSAYVRKLEPDYSGKRVLRVTLYDSSMYMASSSKARNWGRVKSSQIAKKIAERHGLAFEGEDSKDVPADRAFYQAGDMNDFAYLRDLAAMIDFEVIVLTSPPKLVYRKKSYDQEPSGVLTYFDDFSSTSYVKSFKVTMKDLGPVAVQAATPTSKAGPRVDVTGNNPGLGHRLGVGDKGRTEGPTKTQTPSFVRKQDGSVTEKNTGVTVKAPSGANPDQLATISRQQILDKCNEATSEHPLTPSIEFGKIFEWKGVDKAVGGLWYVTEEKHNISGRGSSTSIQWKRTGMNGDGAKTKNTNNKKASGGTKFVVPTQHAATVDSVGRTVRGKTYAAPVMSREVEVPNYSGSAPTPVSSQSTNFVSAP